MQRIFQLKGWQVVKPFAAEVGINYRLVIGDDTTAQLYGGVDALPTAFVIDREGVLRRDDWYEDPGITEVALDKWVFPLLQRR